MKSRQLRADPLQDPGNFAAYGVGDVEWYSFLAPADQMRRLRWAEVAGLPAARSTWIREHSLRMYNGRIARKAAMSAPNEGVTLDVDGVRLKFAIDRRVSSYFFQQVLRRGADGGFLVHEPAVQQAMKRFLRPGSLLVDIGAHVGYFSCYGAALGAVVLAVEMQNTLCDVISVNAAFNDLWSVHTICAAMGREPGMAMLPRIDPRPGMQAMSEKAVPIRCSLESVNHDLVPILTVDQLMSMPELDGVEDILLKIDVEGAETLVLAGATRTIAAGRARFIVEIHPASISAFGGRVEDVSDAFPDDRWRAILMEDTGEHEIGRSDLLDLVSTTAQISGVTNPTVRFEPR